MFVITKVKLRSTYRKLDPDVRQNVMLSPIDIRINNG